MLILYLKIKCGVNQIWCYQNYLVIPTTRRFPDGLVVMDPSLDSARFHKSRKSSLLDSFHPRSEPRFTITSSNYRPSSYKDAIPNLLRRQLFRRSLRVCILFAEDSNNVRETKEFLEGIIDDPRLVIMSAKRVSLSVRTGGMYVPFFCVASIFQ
jgi:hypothetical protein